MKGKSYTKELKESILNEVKKVKNISLVSRKHGISKYKDEIKVKPVRKALIEGQNNFEKEITKENDTLKKILGEKDLEIAILKDLIKKVNPQLRTK